MVRWILSLGLALIFALHASMGAADTPTDIKKYLQSGSYDMASEGGVALGTSEGYALAAEALARQVMLGDVKKLKKTSKAARELAKKALELDPNNQEAQLQHAITDGFVARLSGDVSAWMKKLPQKSLSLIQSYRETYPNDARGDALLGAWHLGVARKAGDKNAMKWFKASVEDGQTYYEMALEKHSDDPIILVNYALALMALGESDYSDWTRSKDLLSAAITLPGEDECNRLELFRHNLAFKRFHNNTITTADGFIRGNQDFIAMA